MKSVMINDIPNINGVSINTTAEGTKFEVAGISSITTNEKILSDVKTSGQSLIPNLITYFATLFLLWVLIKASL